MNKTNLVIAIILGVLLVISIQVYRLFSELPNQAATQQSSMVEDVQPKINSFAPNNPEITPTIATALTPISTQLVCEDFERTAKSFDRSRQRFIAKVAANSFYDGVDKMVILDTLMAEYGVESAVNFVRDISSVSIAHEDFKQHKRKLVEFASNGKESEGKPSLPMNIGWWNTYLSIDATLIERANYTINTLPGVEREVWTRVVEDAITEDDFSTLQHSILQLAKQDYHPIENAMLLLDITQALIRASFSTAQKQRIIDDLSAINSATFFVLARENIEVRVGLKLKNLSRFGIDFRAVNFVNIATLAPQSNEQLLQQWQKSLAQYDKHNQRPKAETWCKENKPKKPVYSVSRVSLTSIINQGDYTALSEFINGCFVIDSIMETDYFLTSQGWDRRKIFSIETMKQEDFKDKVKLIKQGLPNTYHHIFSFTSGDSTGRRNNRLEQLSLLIEHGIYPKDPNIVFALRRINVEDSLSIIKQAGDIATTNQHGASLVFNTMLMGKDDLAKALIRQGFPLTTSVNAPDPLIAYLMRLRSNKREYDMEFLELLMANTPQISRWHINAVHHLKLRGFEHIDAIIEAFPELYPQPPEHLLEIDCDGHFIEFG
ncbi:MAG: hypothetical protein ACPGR2_09665 [Psychrobium sp.]